MTQRYVATTGNDSTGTGAIGSPYATIAKASSVCVAGDTVNVAAGTYTGNITTTASGTSGNNITYVSTTPFGAILVGTGQQTFMWTHNGSFVTIRGFDISTTGVLGIIGYGNNITIDGNYIHDIQCVNYIQSNGGAAIDSTGSNHIIRNNTIVRIGNLQAPNPNIQGIYIAGTGWQVYNNIVGNVISYGIQQWHGASTSIIVNNTCFNCLGGILIGAGDSGALPSGSQNNIVRNNISYANVSYGIRELGTTSLNTYTNNCVNGNPTNWLIAGAHTADVNAAPNFVNYQSSGSGDYHLAAGSPCINTGTATNAPSTDQEGIPRPQGTAFDIGAYEVVINNGLIDATTPTRQMPNGKTGGYTLVMSDEFNSSTLRNIWHNQGDFATSVATTAWDINAGGNSCLRMWWNGNTATDNQMMSSTGTNPFRQRFGFYEASIKMIQGKGFFGGWWLYPYSNSQTENSDGTQQELDITEWFSYENGDHLVDTTNYQSKNCKFTIWTEGGGGTTTLAPTSYEGFLGGHPSSLHGYDSTLSTQFHTYGMEWTAVGGLSFYFDGVKQGTTPDPWGAANNIQLALFLQLWWGPNGGNPTPVAGSTTVGSGQSMQWDYVRVWTIGGSPSPAPAPAPSPTPTPTPTPSPVPMTAALTSATFADGQTINGLAQFRVDGDSIANCELLALSAGTYTPMYGRFTLAPGIGGSASRACTLNWDTTTLSNGPIVCHISAFDQPPGSAGTEIVVSQFHYIINNVAPSPVSISATASAGPLNLDMQFIVMELDMLSRYIRTGKKR